MFELLFFSIATALAKGKAQISTSYPSTNYWFWSFQDIEEPIRCSVWSSTARYNVVYGQSTQQGSTIKHPESRNAGTSLYLREISPLPEANKGTLTLRIIPE